MWRAIRLIPKTFPYIRPYKGLAGGVGILTALGALIALAQPWPLAFLIDNVLGNKEFPLWMQWLADASIPVKILVGVAAGLVLTLITGGASIADEYVKTKLSLKMVKDFRSHIFEHTQKLSITQHEDRSSGQFVFQTTMEADNVPIAVETIPPLAESVLTLVGMFFIVYRLNPHLALLATTIVPFVYQASRYYGDHIEGELVRVRIQEGKVLSIIFESMSMIRVVKAFGREKHHYTAFRDKSDVALNSRLRITVKQTIFSLTVSLVTGIGTAMVLGVGAYSVVLGRLTVGELLVVMAYIAAVYRPLEAIGTTLGNLQRSVVPLRLGFRILETDPDVDDLPSARELTRVEGLVTFDHCHFSYRGREHTLTDVSFEARPGEVVAVVGPTGAGKSTLVSLIPRFLNPTAGRVLIDGQDVRDVTQASLRSHIAVVLQEPLLFSGSIMENIRYGRLEATDQEVMDAARAANAHDFISKLPSGYQTHLGERGSRVSGGERQRISIARAFLRNAPILILDEPTSSVDSKTESVILASLDRLMKGRTTFMIAHRLGTVRNADKIVVLDDGEIVEMGTHDELLAADGSYRKLHDAQTGGRRTMVAAGPPLTDGATGWSGAPEAGGRAVDVAVADDGGMHRRDDEAGPEPIRAPGQLRERPVVVVLGMMTKMPVAGVVWQTLHYLVGLERAGADVYYVEAHGRTPSMFMSQPSDDGAASAAAFLDRVMRRFGFSGRWAYHALYDDGRCFGHSLPALKRLYANADLIINLHGGTIPQPEHIRPGRLAYLETDPVNVQIEVHDGIPSALEYLDAHQIHFTFAENIGNSDCRLPRTDGYTFLPTRQPVVLDWWGGSGIGGGNTYTTVGNWRQSWREVVYDGETYSWSKHFEFEKVLDLPARVDVDLELALASYEPEDLDLLQAHGWRVVPSLGFSTDIDAYRLYIGSSRGEFTVAKDQNVRLRSGWFSDRSATYLAAGRPVVTQDTGFGKAIPTGAGLFSFSSIDEAAAALEEIERDYDWHRDAALALAREHFGAARVMRRFLNDAAVRLPGLRRALVEPAVESGIPEARPGADFPVAEPIPPEDGDPGVIGPPRSPDPGPGRGGDAPANVSPLPLAQPVGNHGSASLTRRGCAP